MGCSLRYAIATVVGVGLFIVVGRISAAADAETSPTVHVKYLSGETELDSLEVGANYFSDLPLPFSQIPQEAIGLSFTCRPHHISQPVEIFAPAGATVFLLIDGNDNQRENERCPQLLSKLADGGWASVGEAQRGSEAFLRHLAVLRKTFDADSHFTVSGASYSGVVVAAKKLAVDANSASVHPKRGASAISTRPSVTDETTTATTAPATHGDDADSSVAVPSTVPSAVTAQANTESSGFSPAARDADAQYAQASKLAGDSYDAAMAAAGQTYLKSLSAALDAALAEKRLAEANRINAEIKAFGENYRTSATTKPAQPEARAIATNLSAEGADAQYKLASKQAAAAYDAAMASARDKYAVNLKTALDTALIAKDLDEANRIDAKMKWLKGDSRTRRSDAPQAHAEDAAQLPSGVTLEKVQQFAGRIRLTSELVGTKWLGMFSDQIVALNADGNGETSSGESMHWVAIGDDQILVFWRTGSVDMWTFDQNRDRLVKRWVGKNLAENNAKDGHRVR